MTDETVNECSPKDACINQVVKLSRPILFEGFTLKWSMRSEGWEMVPAYHGRRACRGGRVEEGEVVDTALPCK